MRVKCEVCQGTGRMEGFRARGRGYAFSVTRCKDCHGTGKVTGRTLARQRMEFDRWLADRTA